MTLIPMDTGRKLTDPLKSYIDSLKQDIEDKFNHSFKSATDFDKLESLVKSHSKDTLNASTLKRIWGYSKTTSIPRRTTLTVLANVLGFRDWESYVEAKRSSARVESGFISRGIADISNLDPGDRISLQWNPDRTITLLCIAKEIFRVEAQENSSLRVGDMLRIVYIREGHPMYCKDVTRGSDNLGDYIAGRENGVHILAIFQ